MNEINKYIVLPTISKIEVDNYTLFKEGEKLEYKFDKGLNLFIGVNGLGKTTTTSLIIYGIVGFTSKYGEEFKIDKDYFINRGSDGSKSVGELIIEFKVGKDVFSIKRLLNNEAVLEFKLNGKIKSNEDYLNDLLKLTLFDSDSDLAFILEKFLVREEEGNYLLWDFKDQSKLLQLLINPIGFKEKYQSKSDELSNLTTEINREKDTKIKAYNERLTYLKETKLKEQSKESKYNISELEFFEKEIKTKTQIREKLKSEWGDSIKSVTNLSFNIDRISSEIEIYNEQILNIENEFYSDSYNNNNVQNSIHKLKHYNNCVFCNTTLKAAKTREILSKIEQNSCPVCTSNLHEGDFKANVSDGSIEDLKEIENRANNLKIDLEKLEKEKLNKKNRIFELEGKIGKLNNEIDDLQIKIFEFQLAKQTETEDNKPSIIDLQINDLNEAIATIRRNIAPKETKAKSLAEELIKLNDNLTKIVGDNQTKINIHFKNYASKYFRDDCQLQTEERQIKKTNNFEKILQSYYVPFFENKKRTLQKHCSTSQRFFLEYLFRLSLLKLYNEVSGNQNSSFTIFETSEGSFDTKFTEKLADTFISFSKEVSFPLVLIINMSKPSFVKKLRGGLVNKKSELNYLDFANITDEDKDFFLKEFK